MAKMLLESVEAFLKNPETPGYEIEDAIDDCTECLEILERRSHIARRDKNSQGQVLAVPEAIQSARLVRQALDCLRHNDRLGALSPIQESLRLIVRWIS